MGLHSNRWQAIQQEHYRRIGSKRCAKQWTSLVIRKLWSIAWDMWQHRCRIAHDDSDKPLCAVDDLNRRIQAEASHGVPRDCPTHYRQHFSHQAVQSVLRQPLQAKQQWIQFAQVLRNQLNEQQSNGTIQQQRQTMYEFLRPASPQWNPAP